VKVLQVQYIKHRLSEPSGGSASKRLSLLEKMSGNAFLTGLAVNLEKIDFIVVVEKRVENFFF
jgi:hypothetical protein